MKKILIITGLVLFTAAACNNSSTPQPVNPTPTPTPSEAPVPPPAQAPAPSPTPVASPVTHTMDIVGFAFATATLTVKVGDTVTWTNKDAVAHTVTGNNGGPDSGSMKTGQSYSYTFTKAGTFSYYCKPHPAMVGKVIVVQ